MQSPVALRPLAPPACFASPEAYTRAVYSTRRQRPHTVVIHASFNAPQTDGEAVKSFCSVARMSSIGSQKSRLPPLRQATAIARGHGDTGRLRPFFCYVRFRTASFNVPVPICFSFLRTAPAVSVSRPAHSVLSRLPPKAYVFPRGFRSYRGAIPGAV